MTATKSTTTKSASAKSEATSAAAVVSIAQLVENTSIARENAVKCFLNLTNISRTASHAILDGVINYGSELHDINTALVKILSDKLTVPGNVLADDTPPPFEANGDASEFVKQLQRVLDANSRLVDATSSAYQTLSSMPSFVLDQLTSRKESEKTASSA